MRLMFLSIIAMLLAFVITPAIAKDREIALNYVDPRGADLALALASHAEELPSWIRDVGAVETRRARSSVVIALRDVGDRDKAITQYSVSATHLSANARSGRAPSNLKLGAASGKPIEIQPRLETQNQLENCGSDGRVVNDCKISDLATKVVLLQAQGSARKQLELRALVNKHGLLFDSPAAKKIVVRTTAKGELSGVDFIGLLRANNETISAPDATPANILRMFADGRYQIIKRKQDAPVDIRKVKFGYEASK